MSLKNNELRRVFLQWFKENKRQLPWRGHGNAYKTWLSEIIMQQTRVLQGTPYYERFIDKFPTVADLAKADEQEVLKLWQGLGYYSRARNLHHAAKMVMSDFGGNFPEDYKDIIKLKGVGPYTAAAIASIAFGKPHAALDGNVYRVLARLFGITLAVNVNGAKDFYQKLADDLLDKDEPGVFNEAMMEFGATFCVPKNPLCQQCPVSELCEARITNMEKVLPVKLSLKQVKIRYFHYLIVKSYKGILLRYRPAGDIWQGLYDLPMIETSEDMVIDLAEINAYLQFSFSKIVPVKRMRHKLTHQHLEIVFYELLPAGVVLEEITNMVVVSDELISQYPFPKPVEIFLNDYLCNPKKP